MENQLEINKALVKRYNVELIEQGSQQSALDILAPGFTNHSAPEGQRGADALVYFFNHLLKPGLSDIKVLIDQQIAEADLVTTHKRITGTHTGDLMGVAATGKMVSIEVIDILKVQHNKVTDHWGINTFATVLSGLAAS
jgi:predicted SnoaL-like aldol condensation-catalyzing enzyme